ncbi:MAG: hypothetical protein NWT08_00815 [Akkermansiaceae bacterium]|jgi:hypothetical protein|nr:hypothetical protein [Akkermansiaceae bacterium]MDP4648083.1 hypothetical protein [Akkermansiaceae bacterium]MDP4721735.1 hypothetical protein [Akkermansiaceae bacterium]MDP4780647.1 hypothetical protein [Akkermansiaceae bacterium]MDP4848471.1 hypothetical protein [Akkermansiaceae bacterium]
MKAQRHILTAALAIFLGSGALAQAHPGAPGHYHPDEVDEFDQVSLTEPASSRNFDIGGILVLTVIAASIGYAFFQKEGGIWVDVTQKH